MSAYDNLYTVSWLLIFVSGTGYWKRVGNGMLHSLYGRLEAVGIHLEYWSQALHESEPGVETYHSASGDRLHMSDDLFRKYSLVVGGLQESYLTLFSTGGNSAYRMWRFQYL